MITFGRYRLSFSKALTFGFLIVIAIGTLLLMLPIAVKPGENSSFMTAFFTATSATCVTGLTLVDTATHWSLFGQLVITALIEIGGLGFMTFAIMMFLFARQKIRLSARLLAQESLNLQSPAQITIVNLIVGLSLIIQVLGALLLWPDFGRRFGLVKGLWYSIFHSISAFCNAGFDLFGNSLALFADDTYVLFIMAVLIIAGLFGFLVWRDLLFYRKKHRLSLHTSLALSTGAIILILSLMSYLLTEDNLAAQFPHMSVEHRFINTIFMAITPRTAGLTTFSYQNLSPAGIAVTVILMFIGGTPGSTAGGIKTTTVGLLTLQSIATLKGQRDTVFGRRRFKEENIFRALTLVFVAFAILAAAILLLCLTQHLPANFTLEDIIFEVMAAFGTTGISMGVTPHLNLFGKLIIMALMFIGRVGIYTVMFTILNAHPKQKNYRYPEEGVLIG